MQDLAQDGHPIHDARAMTAEIPSPVDGIDACRLDRGQVLPLRAAGEWLGVANRSCQVEAAGDEHEDVRPVSRGIIPCDLVRERAVATEGGLPPSGPKNLPNPGSG